MPPSNRFQDEDTSSAATPAKPDTPPTDPSRPSKPSTPTGHRSRIVDATEEYLGKTIVFVGPLQVPQPQTAPDDSTDEERGRRLKMA